MELYYKSSEGVVINLIGDNYKMLSETDIFNTEWQYETVGSNYPYITAFKNQMVSKSCTVVVSGSTNDDLKNNLERLIEVLDRDVRLEQVGRIYYGDYYRECYCTATTKPKIEGRTKASIGLTFVSEDGDWKNNQLQTYTGLSGGIYVNKYSIPIVSSSQEDYSYGEPTLEQGSFRLPSNQEVSLNLSGCETFTFAEVDGSVNYRFDPNDAYETVTPSDCPLEIDTSSFDLDAKIYMRASSQVLVVYAIEPDEDATMIDWISEADDTRPVFTVDLGYPTTLEEISGIKIGKGLSYYANSECYLKISEDGINWTEIDNCEIPSSGATYNELEKTWSSNYPSVRYIRIDSSSISPTPTFAPFCVRTKTFKVKAHLTGEEQNLASQVVVDYAPPSVQTYEIGDTVEVMRKFNSVGYQQTLGLTLPSTTTIVAINNVTLTNNDSVARTLYVTDENQTTIDSIEVSANSTASYSWSGEVEVSRLEFRATASNLVLTSSDFEILEKQTQAPHRYVLNDNYCPSDAIIKIYGATSSPSIIIGANQYGGENFTLSSTQWLEINTKDETMVRTDGEGTENVFYHRLDKSFEKIDTGSQEIVWNGNIKVDIELLNARSDPKWN